MEQPTGPASAGLFVAAAPDEPPGARERSVETYPDQRGRERPFVPLALEARAAPQKLPIPECATSLRRFDAETPATRTPTPLPNSLSEDGATGAS